MKKTNIVLIGMPSCGKSVTGVILAKILKKKYVDGDLLIQEQAGTGLQDIINNEGIEAFKKLEEEVLGNIDVTNCVIATGGSAVYYDSAMKHLSKDGVVVYIDVPLNDLKKRLSNIKTRGVAMAKGQTLDDLYAERKPLYEKYAEIIVRSDNKHTMEETVEMMVNQLKAADK